MQVSVTLARSIAAALALTVASATAVAGELDYTVRTGVMHSDNINLDDADPVDQNVLIPGINFRFTQDGAKVQANVIGDVEYRDYLGNAFDNRTLGQLAGIVNWSMIPERLDFTVQDNASVAPVSALAVDTPDNQQQTNVLALGPTLHFRMGRTIRGQAELRYINSHASEAEEFNSSRGMAALRLFKDFSPNARVSANIETRRVHFRDEAVAPDYDSTNAFARYYRQQSHFDLYVAAGWTQIDFDGAPSESGPLIRAHFGWRPSLRSSFSLEAQRQYSDAASDMIMQTGPLEMANATRRAELASQGIHTSGDVINAQAYLQKRFELTYRFDSDRLTIALTPRYERLDYVNDAMFDRTGHGGSGSLNYRLRELLTLSVFGYQETYTYHTLSRRDRERSYGLSLTDQRTPHWGWVFSLTRRQLDSSVPGLGYEANVVYLGFTYRR